MKYIRLKIFIMKKTEDCRIYTGIEDYYQNEDEEFDEIDYSGYEPVDLNEFSNGSEFTSEQEEDEFFQKLRAQKRTQNKFNPINLIRSLILNLAKTLSILGFRTFKIFSNKPDIF
jgi:hypothetical protein